MLTDRVRCRPPPPPGSIPELEESTDSIFNTCTVYNPAGELVAVHRKVHLFDIDIPGGITFKESDSLTGGKTLNYFETRACRLFRAAHCGTRADQLLSPRGSATRSVR